VPPVRVESVGIVSVIVIGIVAGAFDGGKIVSKDDELAGRWKDGFQGVKVAFEAHARGEEEVDVMGLAELIGGGLEVVGIGVCAKEIDDVNTLAADLAGEVAEKWVEGGDL